MKRTLLINQQAAVESGLDVDFIDLVIFEYIKEERKNLQIGNKTYFTIAHHDIIENLPLLGINTKMGVIKRMKRLEDIGLLIRYPNISREYLMAIYTFGPNAEKL